MERISMSASINILSSLTGSGFGKAFLTIQCCIDQNLSGFPFRCKQRSRVCSVCQSNSNHQAWLLTGSRFDTRDIAECVVKEYHSATVEHDGVKLYLRFADTKAQKQLKQQSQERRQWRSREYSYSVEHTPSPITGRVGNFNHISPNGSYQSPAGVGHNFTPATSVSPP